MTRIAKSLLAAALSIVAFGLTPCAAMAQSYSGSWPIKAALPPHFGDTGCLTLVDTGTGGQHNGSATVSGDLAEGSSGTFQVINNLLVATFETGSDTGEVTYTLYIARASNGNLEAGAFEEPGFFSVALSFGTKNGC